MLASKKLNLECFRKTSVSKPINNSTPKVSLQVRNSSRTSLLRDSIRRKQLLPFPDSIEPEIFLFPNQRLGNTYEVNWSLTKYDVAPSGEAFRNLYLKQLIGRANGKPDKNKVLHASAKGQPEFAVLDALDPALFKRAKQYLEQSPQLFLHDASVGAHKLAEVRVRVITEDGSAALLMHNVLPRLPASQLTQTFEFKHDLLVYYAPGFTSGELTNKGFAHFDPQSSVLVVGGNHSAKGFLDVLASAAAQTLLSMEGNTALPLKAEVAKLKENRSSLVISNGILLKNKLPLYSSHHAFWTHSGVVPAWDGLISPHIENPKKGDIVETLADGSKHLITPYPAPTLGSHPSSLVFMVADSQGIFPTFSKLSPEQAAQHLLAGYTGKGFSSFLGKSKTGEEAGNVANMLKTLLNETNVPVYMVNTNSKGKDLSAADIGKLLEATTDAKTGSSASSKNFSTVSPITSVEGVSVPLDGGDHSKEKQVTDYLKTTFPNVTF